MRKLLEGSMAVAESVKRCRPHVVAAYPITPQTHIVEFLSQMVADGDLKAEFINVESEFGAASVVLGASAVGARAYSATTAQGLLLMAEVLYNIAGMRLPLVVTCANRAVSAPINIWNDHSDVMVVRDSGMILLFAEDAQELFDIHPQAFKIAENPEIMLPVMVNMDGFILTHAFEPVELLEQEFFDEFLPPYNPEYKLDPENPITMGILAEPKFYMETRYKLAETLQDAKPVIERVAEEFKAKSGRWYGGLVDMYRLDDAEIAFVAMGSLIGTLKEVVDDLRAKGEKVGVLKIRSFRPFPVEKIREVCKEIKQLIVIDKSFSYGYGSILQNELRSCFYNTQYKPLISGFVAGLGGRDIPPRTIREAYYRAKGKEILDEFLDVDHELLRQAELALRR